MNIHKKFDHSILSECPLHWEIKAYWHKYFRFLFRNHTLILLQACSCHNHIPNNITQQHQQDQPLLATTFTLVVMHVYITEYYGRQPVCWLAVGVHYTHSTDEGAPDVPVTHESTYSAHIPRVATRQERGGPYNPVRGETNLLQLAQVVIFLYFTTINILF